MLDNFKPVTPKKPNPPITPAVSDDEVLSAFGNSSDQELPPVAEPTDQPQTPAAAQTPGKFVVKTSKPNDKKRTIIIVLCILAAIIAAGGAYWWFSKKPAQAPTASTTVEVTKTVEKAKIYSPLTGVEVASEESASRPVTGVMIENSPDARPQSGLDQAGIVFEAIAEGGITRFLALFQETRPDYLGPVRSARPYYVEWAKMFDASYGHVGGSPDALAKIKALGVKDLDQFANGSSYQRISSRAAPHNVYTDFTKLDALNTAKKYTKSTFTSWERKDDVKQTPTAATIDLSVSGPTYSPRFTYDSSTNSYLRLQEGEPHNVLAKDLQTKKQINPKTVVVLVTTYGLDNDGYHSSYRTTGSGNLYVFQDGIVSVGKWSRADGNAMYVLTDKNGFPMKLNRGQTWVTLVASDSAVSYKP